MNSRVKVGIVNHVLGSCVEIPIVEQHWAPTRLIYEDTSTGIYQRHALYHWIGNFV